MNLTDILNNYGNRYYKKYYRLYFWEHGKVEFWPNIEYNKNAKIIKLNLIGEEKEYKYYIQEINCKFSMQLNNTNIFYPVEIRWGGGYTSITNQYLFPGHEEKGFDYKKLTDIPFESYEAAEGYVKSFKNYKVKNIKVKKKNEDSHALPNYYRGDRVRISVTPNSEEYNKLNEAQVYYINDEVIITEVFKEEETNTWRYKVKAVNEQESEFKRGVKFYIWPEEVLELI